MNISNITRPKLSIYHANSKCTGAAVTFELHPAHDMTEGSIMMRIAPQVTVGNRLAETPVFPRFDWENAITTKLDFNDLCLMLQVFRGETESISEGKGLYHVTAKETRNIKLSHELEPIVSYRLEVYATDRTNPDDQPRRAIIIFSYAEALGICEAISGSMSRIAFGDPIILPVENDATAATEN